MSTPVYQIMGPEGITTRPHPYESLTALVQAAAAFPLRFIHQGYYAGLRDRIPLDELPELLTCIVTHQNEDGDEVEAPVSTPPCFHPPFHVRKCWQTSKDNTRYVIAAIEADGKMPIAYVYDPTTETDENAAALMELGRRFAASTDLLASLVALKEWACTHTSPLDANSPHLLLIDAHNAICKATGKDYQNPSYPAHQQLLDLANAAL